MTHQNETRRAGGAAGSGIAYLAAIEPRKSTNPFALQLTFDAAIDGPAGVVVECLGCSFPVARRFVVALSNLGRLL